MKTLFTAASAASHRSLLQLVHSEAPLREPRSFTGEKTERCIPIVINVHHSHDLQLVTVTFMTKKDPTFDQKQFWKSSERAISGFLHAFPPEQPSLWKKNVQQPLQLLARHLLIKSTSDPQN
ncbi:hypothetical protein O6H91_12G041600 [Diphasiastrum complanatum]|uniref:Uncharacterized protein n=1 Tax=Diphasiastrum complanatum TaxID=34168 RepID=A0ACC2C0U8_DIPCM|nr:hypothetical protein O6H91_12G041600 [Diphasiastrum complanatum]